MRAGTMCAWQVRARGRRVICCCCLFLPTVIHPRIRTPPPPTASRCAVARNDDDDDDAAKADIMSRIAERSARTRSAGRHRSRHLGASICSLWPMHDAMLATKCQYWAPIGTAAQRARQDRRCAQLREICSSGSTSSHSQCSVIIYGAMRHKYN